MIKLGSKSIKSIIIHSGEAVSLKKFITNSAPKGDIKIEASLIRPFAFANKPVKSVIASNITRISSYAFYKCTKLENISAVGVTSVDSYAFSLCSSLKAIQFSDAFSVNSYAFQNCYSLRSISGILKGSIGSYAFNSCSSLDNVVFSSDVSFGNNAFDGCISLTNVNISNLTKTLTAQCLFRSTNISGVYASKVTNVGAFTQQQFAHCKNLIYARFPNSSGTARQGIFVGDTSLKLIDGKWNQITVGSIFTNCAALETLILRHTSVMTLNNTDNFTGVGSSGPCKVYVPMSLVSSYQSATNWSTLVNNNQLEFMSLESSPYSKTDYVYMGVPSQE